MKFKVCSKCGLEKPINEFHKSSIHSNTLYPSCKACKNANKRDHYQNNKEQYKEKDKIHYKNNKERRLKKSQEYRKNHKDYYNNYNILRRKEDNIFRLTHNLRIRLSIALRKNIKSKSTLDLLGCSLDFLKEHLESQFKPGMSWDNYGNGKEKWSIDHIIPLSKFDLRKKSEQQKAFHYTNLQPLWCIENSSKRDKILKGVN